MGSTIYNNFLNLKGKQIAVINIENNLQNKECTLKVKIIINWDSLDLLYIVLN